MKLLINVLTTMMLLTLPFIASAETITRLTVTGPVGEYVSQGQTYILSESDGDFLVRHDSNNGISIQLFSPNRGWWWTVQFGGPHASSPQVGTYDDCMRYGFNNDQPGLAIYGDGRGCNESSGSFTVKHLVYSEFDVESLWVVFDQCCDNCEGKMLHGEFIYNMDASVPTKPKSWGQLKSYYR